MVSIPHSYNLNDENVSSVIEALEGDVVEQAKWIAKFKSWQHNRKMQLQVYNLVKEYYTEFGKANGWDRFGGEENGWYSSAEEALRERVYNQMERTPFQWSEKEQKVIWNKYSSSGYLPNATEEKILTYLNENIKI